MYRKMSAEEVKRALGDIRSSGRGDLRAAGDLIEHVLARLEEVEATACSAQRAASAARGPAQ